MGAWGIGSFENDTASDWIYGLKPAKKSLLGKLKNPFAYPMNTIDNLLGADDELEAPDCEEAIAAAECIAAANGNPPQSPPEELVAWHASLGGTRPDDAATQRAAQALERVRDSEESELRALYEETEDAEAWRTAINDLLARLRAG